MSRHKENAPRLADPAKLDLAQLVEIVRTEMRQRQALEKRLAGRKRPAREVFEEVGAPMLDERG